MTRSEFDRFCASLPHTSRVVQWGGSSVWKVAGKVFAIGGWDDGGVLGVTFKVSELGFEILKDQPGCRPAPYLASRGMSWIQRVSAKAMNDNALKDHLKESYRLVVLGLPKAKQQALGLEPDLSRHQDRKQKPAIRARS